MKKLLKALGITIALITVGAVTRARVKKRFIKSLYKPVKNNVLITSQGIRT